MAQLREVIIGNIRLTISAGMDPADRQISARGEATVYDQSVNPTRSYTGDLTANMTPQDQTQFEALIDRLIQGVMDEYEITQADLDAGAQILSENAVIAPQSLAPPALPQPVEPGPPSISTSLSPEGTLSGAGEPVATPPSTDTGDGTLTPAPDAP